MFENELSQTLTETVGKVLSEYVTRPYHSVWDDYVEKSHMEAQLFNDRVDAVIKTSDQHF